MRESETWDNGPVKPFDPRLLKYAQSTRRFIVEIAVLGLITAILVILQAFTISNAVSPVITNGTPLQDILPTILILFLILVTRALVT